MLEKPVIAIVDDDESIREAILSLLKSLGYAAETFASGDAFLQSGRSRHTDCLIADVQMPGMTGLALYDRLVDSGTPIPTVLITAYPHERIRARAKKAGIECYLTKPFNEEALLDGLRKALARVRRPTQDRKDPRP